MLNYDITRMKHRVEFGTYHYVEDDTISGGHEDFVPMTEVWCGEYTNTQTQTFSLLGLQIDADVVLVIRHNPNINKKVVAKYQGKEYRIVAISSDDRLNAFDLVTLQVVKGLKG